MIGLGCGGERAGEITLIRVSGLVNASPGRGGINKMMDLVLWVAILWLPVVVFARRCCADSVGFGNSRLINRNLSR